MNYFQVTEKVSDKSGLINDGFDMECEGNDREIGQKKGSENTLDNITFIKENENVGDDFAKDEEVDISKETNVIADAKKVEDKLDDIIVMEENEKMSGDL